jgi:hypothetical protein
MVPLYEGRVRAEHSDGTRGAQRAHRTRTEGVKVAGIDGLSEGRCRRRRGCPRHPHLARPTRRAAAVLLFDRSTAGRRPSERLIHRIATATAETAASIDRRSTRAPVPFDQRKWSDPNPTPWDPQNNIFPIDPFAHWASPGADKLNAAYSAADWKSQFDRSRLYADH